METRERDSDECYDKRKNNADEMYCYSCGRIVKQQAAVCPSCGVTVSRSYVYVKAEKVRIPREKETAIFLALFTSFFVWLYLYEKSFIRFWGGLVVSVVSGIMAVAFFNYWFLNWYFAFIPLGLVWLFAIVDVVRRDSAFFSSFTIVSKGVE